MTSCKIDPCIFAIIIIEVGLLYRIFYYLYDNECSDFLYSVGNIKSPINEVN